MRYAKQNIGLYSLFATGLVVASVAHGGPFDFGGSIEKQLEGVALKSETSIDLTAFKNINPTGFGLSLSTGDDPIRSLLNERGLNPYLNVQRLKVSNTSSFGLTAGSSQINSVSDYQFQAGSFPICGVSLRSVQHVDGTTVVVGNIPLVDQVGNFSNTDWPDQTESARFGVESLAQHLGQPGNSGSVVASKRCLLNEQGSLDPVWNFVVSFGGVHYEVWSTPWRVSNANPRSLDATATIRAYDPNILGSLKDFSVTVNGDGTMTNDYFTTADYTGAARASSTTNSFVYAGTSDSHFAEASTFAYVNQQYDFVKSMGYTWVGAKPIKVITRAIISGTTNNALYTPSADGSSSPTIKVGDGDGATLQNLAYDSDVVSHEFGHHVIYQSITNIAGDSLILHEGLADFLAMSRTGDSCLGESICPSTSALCQVKSKCLRSADNTISYNDSTYSGFGSSAHLKGQLVSGLLWDLRKDNAIPGDTLTKYMLQAIPYFPSNAGFKSLIAGLLYVDQKNGGTYQSVITTAATNRGLSPTSLGIDTTNLQTAIQSSGSSSSSSDDSSSKKGGFFGCTIGAGANGQGSAAWMLVVLFGLPLILRALPKRQIATVPVKAKRK